MRAPSLPGGLQAHACSLRCSAAQGCRAALCRARCAEHTALLLTPMHRTHAHVCHKDAAHTTQLRAVHKPHERVTHAPTNVTRTSSADVLRAQCHRMTHACGTRTPVTHVATNTRVRAAHPCTDTEWTHEYIKMMLSMHKNVFAIARWGPAPRFAVPAWPRKGRGDSLGLGSCTSPQPQTQALNWTAHPARLCTHGRQIARMRMSPKARASPPALLGDIGAEPCSCCSDSQRGQAGQGSGDHSPAGQEGALGPRYVSD